jgi:hypothetical protein
VRPTPALSLAVALAATACKDGGPIALPATSASATPAFSAPAAARRPVRRFYLAHTATRCEIYFADPGSVSTPLPTPCPSELQVGERIRVAGKTCVREGGERDRSEPVVCPDPLTDFERRDRGEKP